MKKKENLLTPIKFSHKNGGRILFVYRCKCGNLKIIRKDAVDSGNTRSCGCIHKSMLSSGIFRRRHGLSKTRFWRIWSDMKRRINHKHRSDYVKYGGRGITYSKRWNKFDNFKIDMYQGYQKHVKKYGSNNTTIDRIDVNKNYTKNNCKWSTWKEQANNTRRNVYIKYNDVILTQTQWEEKLNLPRGTIYKKRKLGLKIKDILKTCQIKK